MPSEPTPDPAGSGRALLDLAARWQGNPAFDDTFERNVREVREALRTDLDTDPWLD
ncbi:MAG TPA: hypothetical protein VG247_13705 [Pseudonocardiaceae bacterium]|nr:hypothetical protein [Pseudonocardiaceae bacterium]